MPEKGWPHPTAERLAAVADLALALGNGCTKLCEALSLVYGERDERRVRADGIDRQLQPLTTQLGDDSQQLRVKPV